MGVIPENYVQALADPPEPNEPPPLTTFNQGHSTSNTYNGNNNPRTSFPPAYDEHYMNSGSIGNWQPNEPKAWSPPPPPQQPYAVRYMHCFPCINHLLLLY